MGCDIHMLVEAKVDDKWVCVNTMDGHYSAFPNRKPYDWSWPTAEIRNYRRFAQLAGVRGDGPEPRGLPDDLSETGRYLADEWDGDGHSHSWLPLFEAALVFVETEESLSDYAAAYPVSYFFNVTHDQLEKRDYRLVFWFDN